MQLAPGQRVGAPLGRGAHRRGCREDLRCLRAGTRRDLDVAPGTVQDQGLVHRHRRRRVGPAARHSARQNRESAHPVAAETAPQLAGADPLGGAGPLGPLPGRVQRRAARREAGRGPLPRRAVGQRRPRRGPPPVQNQTLGHRGHKHDPLYRARKLLVSASENITDNGHTKLRGLLDAGDPYGEVRDAWHAKETLRGIYDIDDAKWAPPPSTSSPKTSRTPPCHQRSTGWAAPSGTGDTRSPTGTPPESPTHPPKPSTTWSNASNAAPSGSPTSTTTGSAPCYMPANPTGHSSKPSLRPKTRSAPLAPVLGWMSQPSGIMDVTGGMTHGH